MKEKTIATNFEPRKCVIFVQSTKIKPFTVSLFVHIDKSAFNDLKFYSLFQNFPLEAEKLKELELAQEGEELTSPAAEGTTPSDPILPHSVKRTDKGRNLEFRDLPTLNSGDMSKIEKLLQGSLKEDLDKLSDQFGGKGAL